jgi:hypothetical protein
VAFSNAPRYACTTRSDPASSRKTEAINSPAVTPLRIRTILASSKAMSAPARARSGTGSRANGVLGPDRTAIACDRYSLAARGQFARSGFNYGLRRIHRSLRQLALLLPDDDAEGLVVLTLFDLIHIFRLLVETAQGSPTV